MDNCYYFYEVEYWDDVYEKNKRDIGIVAAASYGHAANTIEEYYGECNLIKFNELFATDAENVFSFESQYNDYMKKHIKRYLDIEEEQKED